MYFQAYSYRLILGSSGFIRRPFSFFLFYQLEQEIPEAEVQEPTLMDIDDSLSSMVRDGNKRLYYSSYIPSKLLFHFLGWC